MIVTRKWVILEFGKGSFETGFPVTVRIGTDGIEGSERIPDGFLPPAPPSLTEFTLKQWRGNFEELIKYCPSRKIKATAQSQTASSGVDFYQQTKDLENDVKNWLNSEVDSWQKVIRILLAELNKQDEIRVVIQTDNCSLRRIPWHAWELFSDHFPQTEFAFSPSQQKKVNVTSTIQKKSKLKILVILGDPLQKGHNKKVDYQSEIDAIKKLGADVDFLPQPTHQTLVDKLWEKDWKIIFYSGHSRSEEDNSKGYLQLRGNEFITIDCLKESLKKSISKGLQLVVFNSCQGLGIAKQLEDLALPQVIVMREKLPDVVAQTFLQDFLKAFAGGNGDRSLHDALREARHKLRDKWEKSYPGISWLPMICQHYADMKLLKWYSFSFNSWIWYKNQLVNTSRHKILGFLAIFLVAPITFSLIDISVNKINAGDNSIITLNNNSNNNNEIDLLSENSLIQEGYELLQQGEFKIAEAKFNEARRLNPQSPEPLYWKARLALAMENKFVAMRYIEKSLELNPNYIESLKLKIQLLLLNGGDDINEAKKLVEKNYGISQDLDLWLNCLNKKYIFEIEIHTHSELTDLCYTSIN